MMVGMLVVGILVGLYGMSTGSGLIAIGGSLLAPLGVLLAVLTRSWWQDT
jgi:hypothetical protein